MEINYDIEKEFYTLEQMKKYLDQIGLDPETFCLAPYITTDLDQDGSVLTCYRGKTRLGNWKKQPFEESFNGDKIKKIRSDLFMGVKNSNCRSCYAAEDNGSISPRLNFFNDYINNFYQEAQLSFDNLIKQISVNEKIGNVENIVRTEIRPSSLCNQRCMHCGPHSSTRWIETFSDKEKYELYIKNSGLIQNGRGPLENTDINYDEMMEYYKDFLNSESDYLQDVLNIMDKSKDITFTGGEPLLNPDHSDYLDYFANVTKSSKNKILTYSTNLNIKNIEKFFDYWKEFKSVNFRISIDSNFDNYEYFRTFGDIKLVKKNIKKLHDFKKYCEDNNHAIIKIDGIITFSMFSALRWDSIMKDWDDYDLNFAAALIIDHPVSVKYLPKDLSQKALDNMQHCIEKADTFYKDDRRLRNSFIHHTTNCINYIRGFNNQFTEFPDFVIKYIDFCDKTSGNNVLNYYPELEEYLKL